MPRPDLTGVFLCMQSEIRQMLAQGDGGAIVNVSSGAGIVPAGLEMIDRPATRAVEEFVRRHPVTGRRALYVNNNFTTRILGITKGESDVLLPYLLQHVQRPDFQVRFRWAPGGGLPRTVPRPAATRS